MSRWKSIMKRSQCVIFMLTVFLLVILSSCGNSEDTANSGTVTTFPEPVTLTTIQTDTIPIYYEAVGTIKAKTSTILSSKVPGHIKKIAVNEGDAVSAGDEIVLIDDRTINAKLDQAEAAYESSKRALDEITNSIKQAEAKKDQAEANLSLARTTYSRYETLYQEKATSDQEFDTVKAKLQVSEARVNEAREGISGLMSKKKQVAASIEQAKSAVEEANVMKSYTRVKAPFDGIIIRKHVEVGSLAVPGVPLVTLENPQGFQLEVDVREKEFANKVQLGRNVDVQIDALGSRTIEGRVAEIVPAADPMTRTFKVKIALPDLPGIKSGMYGKAMCFRGEREGILIPTSAYLKRGQLEQVFTVNDDNRAILRLIKTGKTFKDKIEVSAGLRQGDKIISSPPNGLKDGYNVRVEGN